MFRFRTHYPNNIFTRYIVYSQKATELYIIMLNATLVFKTTKVNHSGRNIKYNYGASKMWECYAAMKIKCHNIETFLGCNNR